MMDYLNQCFCSSIEQEVLQTEVCPYLEKPKPYDVSQIPLPSKELDGTKILENLYVLGSPILLESNPIFAQLCSQ